MPKRRMTTARRAQIRAWQRKSLLRNHLPHGAPIVGTRSAGSTSGPYGRRLMGEMRRFARSGRTQKLRGKTAMHREHTPSNVTIAPAAAALLSGKPTTATGLRDMAGGIKAGSVYLGNGRWAPPGRKVRK